ncbi:MAG: virulence RhuM family protein [Akkermansia sp.]|nr:virulence RhuM family protein [Akkermansia sp.]
MKPNTQISTQLTFHDGELVLPVLVDAHQDTVWLNRQQMAELFDRDVKTIGKHISNALKEELEDSVVAKFATTAADGKTYQVDYYNLDMIISVGYRVKSARGVQFRRWANGVLRNYLLQGYAANRHRLDDLSCVLKVMKRVEHQLDTGQVLDVVQQYAESLRLLDDYDHQRLGKPAAAGETYRLTYRECRELIDSMSYGSQSTVFGNEKDDSFKGSINAIYQSFGGRDVYPTTEEKGANLLYLVTKNHAFSDGNKRIAAAVFLLFLQKNGLLFRNGEKVIADHTLVAMVVMIAESKPMEKETMVKLVMNFLAPES